MRTAVRPANAAGTSRRRGVFPAHINYLIELRDGSGGRRGEGLRTTEKLCRNLHLGGVAGQERGHRRSRQRQPRRDRQRRCEPVAERGRRGVAAGARRTPPPRSPGRTRRRAGAWSCTRPEALPMSPGATALMTAFWADGIAIEIPAPAMTIGAIMCRVGHPGLGDRARSSPCRRPASASPSVTSGRSPTRLVSAPAIGATMNSVAVHGSSRSPESSGPWPSETCWNWAMKNTALNSAAENRKLDAVARREPAAREHARRQHRRAARRSTARTPPARSTPAASEPTTSRLPQPASLPRMSPHTIPSAAAGDEHQAGEVERARGP